MPTLRDVLRPVVGLLVGALAAEALAQGLLAVPSIRDRVRDAAWPVVFAIDWRDEVRQDFGGEGRLHRFDPVLGWAPHPGATIETGLATAHVGPDGHRVVPGATPGGRPVLVYGDSFTFGWDVQDDQTLAARLATRRPDLTPENLGVPGYDLSQVVLAWRQRPHGDRAVVVVGMIDLLVSRTVEPFQVYVRPTIPAERGVFEPEPVPPPDELWWTLRTRPALRTLLEASRWASAKSSGRADALAHARAAALLERFAAEVAQAGDTLVVLPMPVSPTSDPVVLRGSAASIADVLGPVRGRGDVVVPDPVPALERVAATGDLLVRGHYSAASLDALAATLAEAIPPTPGVPSAPEAP